MNMNPSLFLKLLLFLSSTWSTYGIISSVGLRTRVSPLNKKLFSLRTGHEIRINDVNMSLIHPCDPWSIYAVISSAAVLGSSAEKSKLGKALSGPVCCMLIGSILCHVNILPAAGSPHIKNLQTAIVKVATPLLLLGADLKKIVRITGKLFPLFFIAISGTVLGAVIGTYSLRSQLKNVPHMWKVLSALTAKNIGGGLNFLAVSELLEIQESLVLTSFSVDNILGLIYFPLIGWLARDELVESTDTSSTPELSVQSNEVSLNPLSLAVALGLTIVAVSEKISDAMRMDCSPLISTLIAVATATFFSDSLAPISAEAEKIGKYLLLLFFTSVGACSENILSASKLQGFLPLLCYGAMMYSVHLCSVLVLGKKFMNASMKELLIASNACIGNAATASSFAQGKGWSSMVAPALLVGTFGNSIGTFIGVGVGSLIMRRILS